MFTEILEARKRLQDLANVTPVMTSRTLNEILGARVFFKCENLQRVGAFKFRGAFNAIDQLTDGQKARGVITFSSGNHAQAVALVGKLLNVKTTVVMPSDAPAVKRLATEGYGATVIDYNPAETQREALALTLQNKYGYAMIPPFDHPDVIAGQGTLALEMDEQCERLDQLLIPCGGGGLLSGCAVAMKGIRPECRIIGIEPERADDATRSFRTGQLHRIENPRTIADGTRTPSLGEITFPLICKHVDDMQTVSEAAIKAAVRFLFLRMKLVVEPSGALGLAALLCGSVKPAHRVGVILSGGNMDADTLATIFDS